MDLWHGNQAADAAAKARACLLLPPSAVCDILNSAEAARVKLYRGAARLLSLYRHQTISIEHRSKWVCLPSSLSCTARRREVFVTQPCRECTTTVVRSIQAALAFARLGMGLSLIPGPRSLVVFAVDVTPKLVRLGWRDLPTP